LRESIAGAAVGAPYTEGSFRLILDASVRPVYEARGRLRVAFPRIRTEPVTDVKGLHIFVTVSEGESYKFGNVEIAGPAPLPPQDLLNTGEFKTGDMANFDRVKEGLEKIRKAVRRAGYLDVKVATDRDIHDAEKTVDVAVRIDAGPQYTMGKLNVVGLDLTAEAEMNRIWAIKEGKPFDPDYPALFLDRVREEGLFDNLGKTKPETRIDEKSHTVDVTLTFAGENPTTPGPTRRRP
jgi:outer membrane protein insertion porin family